MTFSHFNHTNTEHCKDFKVIVPPKEKDVITPLFQTCMTFCVLMNSEEDILKNVKAQTAL